MKPKNYETKLIVGSEFRMKFPFNRIRLHKNEHLWMPGCVVDVYEEDGFGPSGRDYIAHGEGTVVYEILSIAEMPGKYLDRVIFKRSTFDPDGVFHSQSVRLLTYSKFISDVNSETPFKVDYDLEEAA